MGVQPDLHVNTSSVVVSAVLWVCLLPSACTLPFTQLLMVGSWLPAGIHLVLSPSLLWRLTTGLPSVVTWPQSSDLDLPASISSSLKWRMWSYFHKVLLSFSEIMNVKALRTLMTLKLEPPLLPPDACRPLDVAIWMGSRLREVNRPKLDSWLAHPPTHPPQPALPPFSLLSK